MGFGGGGEEWGRGEGAPAIMIKTPRRQEDLYKLSYSQDEKL